MLFSTGKKNSARAVFHISTSSVSALAYSLHKENGRTKPLIQNILRSAWEVGADASSDALSRRTLEGMRHLVPLALKEAGHAPPESIVMGLSAPFYSASTATRTLKRQNFQEAIQQSELDTMLQQKSDKLVVFARIPQIITVNGYRVVSPIGVKGKTIQIQTRWEATASTLHKNLLAPFELLGMADRVRLTSVPNAYFHALRNGTNPDDAALYIDIGGEMTNVFMVSGGVLFDVILIPEGLHSLIRRAAELLRKPLPEVDFLMKRFSENTLDESARLSVGKAIHTGIMEWKQKLAAGLKDYSAATLLPSHVFLCGEGARVPAYKDALTEPESWQGISVQTPVSVNILKPEALREQFHGFEHVQGPEDLGLLCLTLLSMKELL